MASSSLSGDNDTMAEGINGSMEAYKALAVIADNTAVLLSGMVERGILPSALWRTVHLPDAKLQESQMDRHFGLHIVPSVGGGYNASAFTRQLATRRRRHGHTGLILDRNIRNEAAVDCRNSRMHGRHRTSPNAGRFHT